MYRFRQMRCPAGGPPYRQVLQGLREITQELPINENGGQGKIPARHFFVIR
jgi:hypothetical protein